MSTFSYDLKYEVFYVRAGQLQCRQDALSVAALADEMLVVFRTWSMLLFCLSRVLLHELAWSILFAVLYDVLSLLSIDKFFGTDQHCAEIFTNTMRAIKSDTSFFEAGPDAIDLEI